MHYIDIDSWERKGNYTFFKNFLNSWYTLTTEIDISLAKKAAKERDESLFLYYLYAILYAANHVKELRTRQDNEDRLIQHDRVDIITPVALANGNFYTLRIPYSEDFEAFYSNASQLIANVPQDGDPYEAELQLMKEDIYDVIHLSAVPNLSFTSLSFTANRPGRPCSWPLSCVGKIVTRRGKYFMPFAIYVNHAFVDGSHLSAMMEQIQYCLSQLSSARKVNIVQS